MRRLLQFKTRGREAEKVEETRRQFNPGWLEVDVVCESAGGNLMRVNGSLQPRIRCRNAGKRSLLQEESENQRAAPVLSRCSADEFKKRRRLSWRNL